MIMSHDCGVGFVLRDICKRLSDNCYVTYGSGTNEARVGDICICNCGVILIGNVAGIVMVINDLDSLLSIFSFCRGK